jgi:L-lactate utilization protein LutB
VRVRRMVKCVILPSIATSVFADVTSVKLMVTKISFEELVSRLKSCETIVNYVRHHPTNQLLSKYISFTSGVEYRLDASDRIYIVGLKARTPVSGQDVNVTENDLLILEVQVV